jgi:hypothetical protein
MPGWKGTGFACEASVNATDEETQRRKVAGSKAIIARVRQIRAEEEKRARDETDREHADRVADLEERIADILRKRQIEEEREQRERVGTLESRVDAVAKTAQLISEQKVQQLQLIKNLEETTTKSNEAVRVQIDRNSRDILQKQADDLWATSNANYPPEVQKIVTVKKDVKLIQPEMQPVHSIDNTIPVQVPVLVDSVEAAAIPVIARAVVQEAVPVLAVENQNPDFVRPELRV